MKNKIWQFAIVLGCVSLIPTFKSFAQEGGCVGLVSKKCHTAVTTPYPGAGIIYHESDGFIQTCGSGLSSLQCIDAGTSSCTWDSWITTSIGDSSHTHHSDPAVPVTAPDPSYPCNIAKSFHIKEWVGYEFCLTSSDFVTDGIANHGSRNIESSNS